MSPSGLPAVENSLALLLNQVSLGICTIDHVVRWMCDAPARVWDIVNKGRIAPGYDADLVLVDLEVLEARHGGSATLASGAVISGDQVRRLAQDANVTRIVTKGRSEPLDVGRSTRTVPPAIAKAVIGATTFEDKIDSTVIHIARGSKIGEYEILGGLQLTKEQLDYNIKMNRYAQ